MTGKATPKTKKTKKAKKTPCYRALIEVNDWEGETWKFFIPIEGNETALEDLQERLSLLCPEDEPFRMGKIYNEETVDVLEEECEECTGYMASYQKLEGVLVLPDHDAEIPLLEVLYKGGIVELMQTTTAKKTRKKK